MGIDMDHTVQDLLNSPAGARFSGKKKDIEQLVSSSDGQKVKEILGKGDRNLKSAVEKGDMTTLKAALSDILKTEEGARLVGKLTEMLKDN